RTVRAGSWVDRGTGRGDHHRPDGEAVGGTAHNQRSDGGGGDFGRRDPGCREWGSIGGGGWTMRGGRRDLWGGEGALMKRLVLAGLSALAFAGCASQETATAPTSQRTLRLGAGDQLGWRLEA